MFWNERTLKYPEVSSLWPFLELHLSLMIQEHSLKAITVDQVSECFGTRIFQCFHCCTCTSRHWAKNLGTWNSWKPGSRVKDWIIDEDKRVRAVFVCLVNLCVVGTHVISHVQQHLSTAPHCLYHTVLSPASLSILLGRLENLVLSRLLVCGTAHRYLTRS